MEHKSKVRQLLAAVAIMMALVLWTSPAEPDTVAALSPLGTELMGGQSRAIPGEILGGRSTEQAEIEAPAVPPPPTSSEPQAISLGTFTLYAYCPCEQCCGQWSGGPTASGVMPQQGRTIGVDPSVIPLGSLVLIGGASYIAEDTGAGVEGKTIDVYHESHAAALEFGRQEAEVWVVQ